ncbi:uncharacterized protein LOC121837238, partial [Ixodes scapularis]|uniref:uncharacterized protein LOC121837238 n=1 Tax=Ixodes scapularis TaxID=6945 RepID=UPI00116177D7
MVVGEEVIPENITTLLSKGPKYGIEPSIPAHELVALNRRVASKADKEDQERCLLEGVDCLLNCAPRTKRLDLTKLAKDVSKCKIDALSVFFSAKTHKSSVPFLAIVSEKGTWQLLTSQFLLKHLKCLQVTDPFLTKRSDEVAD